MTDFPIIFSGPMVRALLDGRKTQTRRLLYSRRKMRPPGTIPASASMMHVERGGRRVVLWPPMEFSTTHYWTLSGWQNVKPGDRLWARETFAPRVGEDGGPDQNQHYVKYRASAHDQETPYNEMDWHTWPRKWTSPIHMPRWASRLTLIVTATKIEPVQKIIAEDAEAEGVLRHVAERSLDKVFRGERDVTAIKYFGDLWRSLHGAESWDSNPEVVAMTFRVIKENIDNVRNAA